MTSWKNNNTPKTRRLIEEVLDPVEKSEKQEIKTVSYREFRRELYKLQEKYGKGNSHVSVFELGNGDEDSPIQVGVSWASIGTVSPEKAEEFAHALSEAIKDSRNFKYNGYVIDWYAPSERN